MPECHAPQADGLRYSGANIVASAHELVHYITVTESRVVFCDPSAIAKVKDAVAMLPKDFAKPTVVGLGEPGSLPLAVRLCSEIAFQIMNRS